MFRGKVGRWTETDLVQLTQQQCSVWVCAHMAVYMLKTKRWRYTYFNETADSIMPADREDHTHMCCIQTQSHSRGCRQTCECLETQCRSTLRTLLVAARRMMKSLSQVLSEFVKTAGKIQTFIHFSKMHGKKFCYKQKVSLKSIYMLKHHVSSVWRVNFIGGVDNLVN